MVEEILTECPRCKERGYVPRDQKEATCAACSHVYECKEIKKRVIGFWVWVVLISVAAFGLVVAVLASMGVSDAALKTTGVTVGVFGAIVFAAALTSLLVLILMWICLPWLILSRMKTMIRQNEQIIGILREK